MNLVRFQKPRYSVNQSLVDQLFNDFLRNDFHENYLNNCKNSPATNVFETENEFKIQIQLPGFSKENLNINFQNSFLTVKVEKENTEKQEEYKYAHREFEAYNFEKQFRVPKTVDSEKINAKFENGILNILLPKKEEALEKAPVEIKVS
jgi:HSP20 family protein